MGKTKKEQKAEEEEKKDREAAQAEQDRIATEAAEAEKKPPPMKTRAANQGRDVEMLMYIQMMRPSRREPRQAKRLKRSQRKP